MNTVKRLNLPLILDTLVCSVCAFLLFFTALRYYTKNVALALCFGVFAAALFGALGFLYIAKKQNAKLLISRDEKQKKLLSVHLSLSSDVYVRNLLKKLLGENAKICGNSITVNDKKCFFDFKMQPLGEDDIAKIIKRKGEKKVLFCTALTPQAQYLADNFMIETRTLDAFYDELKEKKLFPEKFVFKQAPKQRFFKRVQSRFTRKLCAPLFWSGAALLVLSWFSFFPIYYIVSGSVMLLLSASALVFGKK